MKCPNCGNSIMVKDGKEHYLCIRCGLRILKKKRKKRWVK